MYITTICCSSISTNNLRGGGTMRSGGASTTPSFPGLIIQNGDHPNEYFVRGE